MNAVKERTDDPLKYWAFISYSSKDRRWGQWLHRRLESYPIPRQFQGTRLFDGAVLGRNLRPIFRDRDELSGSSELGPAIQHALEQTRYLIVLCSKSSAKSKWVNKEIEDFKATGREKNILALILDGEPNATSRDDLPDSEECFPPALRYPAEPLAGDLRKEGDGKERGFLKILAGAAELDFDALYRRHERATRRRRLLATGLSLLVMLVLAGLAAFAFQQKRSAERNKDEALAARDEARMRKMEAEARKEEVIMEQATSEFLQGTRLIESQDTFAEGIAHLAKSVRTGRHEGALARLWILLQQRSLWLPSDVPDPHAGPEVSVAPEVPPAIQQRFSEVTLEGQKVETQSIVISPRGDRLITIAGGVVDGLDVQGRLWSVDGSPLSPWFKPNFDGNHYVAGMDAVFSQDGEWLALVVAPWREPHYIEVREVAGMGPVGGPIKATGRGHQSQYVPFSTVQFLPPRDPRTEEPEALLVTASERGGASVHAIVSKYEDNWELAGNLHTSRVSFACVDASQQWLMSGSEDGEVRVARLSDGRAVGQPLIFEAAPTALSREGELGLVVGFSGREPQAFRLMEPLDRPLPEDPGAISVKDPFVAWRSEEVQEVSGEEKPVFDHSESGQSLFRLGPRQFGVGMAQDGGSLLRSPVFANDLEMVGFNGEGSHVVSVTTNFVTEIRAVSDLSVRVAPPLLEGRLFTLGETPERTSAVQLSSGTKRASIESFLWDPPNLAHRWFSLWDVASGRLLSDRMHLADDGMSDDAVITTTRFTEDGDGLLFVDLSDQKDPKIVDWIQIDPPEEVRGLLPELLESIGGMTIDSRGFPAPTPERKEKIRELLPGILK